MKALVKYSPGDGNVDIRDVEEPRCGDGQVKLEIAYCGICGTDLHVFHDTFRNYPPVILGHEFAGRVVEVGKSAGSSVRIGDVVAGLGATAIRCGRCTYCLSGNFMFCKARRGMGHGTDGAFTRYVVMRPDQLYRVPPGLTLEEAALSEPFAAVVHAVTEISPVRIGQKALISGPGPIGLLCLKLLVAQGVPAIVAGTAHDTTRLEAAARFGAATVVNVNEQNLDEAIAEFTSGLGVDVAFECSGHPDSVCACLKSLSPMGHHTQVGVCGQSVSIPMDLIFSRQLTLAGSICYTEQTWDRMMHILAAGNIRLGDLVSDKLPISDWRTAFDLCQNRQALKVLMHPID